MEARLRLEFMQRDTMLVAFAIILRDIALLKTLISRSVSLDGAVYFESTRLHLRRYDHQLGAGPPMKVLKVLLDSGTNSFHQRWTPNMPHSHYWNSPEPLLRVYDNKAWDSALRLAIRNGFANLVELLLSYDTSAASYNYDGTEEWPLLTAVICRRNAIAQILLREEPTAVETKDASNFVKAIREPRISDSEKTTESMQASENAANWLFRWAVKRNRSLRAVKGNTRNLIRQLHATGSFTARTAVRGQTALWEAAFDGNHDDFQMALTTDGVDLNKRDDTGQTLLTWAARNNDLWIIQVLLETGKVDVNGTDEEGRTALWWAGCYGRIAITTELLHHEGIDVSKRDQYGDPPWKWAKHYGHRATARLLLNHNASKK